MTTVFPWSGKKGKVSCFSARGRCKQALWGEEAIKKLRVCSCNNSPFLLILYLKWELKYCLFVQIFGFVFISLPFLLPIFFPVKNVLVPHLVSCLFSRVPGATISTIGSVPPAPAPGLATNPEPSSNIWAGDGSRLSSDEGDAETAEDGDRPPFHFSNHHPQPLGVNIITIYNFFTVHFNIRLQI